MREDMLFRASTARSDRSAVRQGLSAVVAITLVVAAVGVGVGGTVGAETGSLSQVASDDPTEETVIVRLDERGDAALTLAVPFDLTDSETQQEFEEFRSDTHSQRDLLDSYESRLLNVAAATNEQTDREMRLSDTQIEFTTAESGSVGVVHVTATWEGLAAVEDDQLSLSSPFDSGFAPDRTVVVELPAGYEVADATPEPAVAEGSAVWESDQSLDGFTLTAEPVDDTAATDSTDESGSGFGVLSALLAFGGLLVAVRVG